MIRPKIPVNPLPTSLVTPLAHQAADLEPRTGTVPACDCHHTPAPATPRVQLPAVRLTPAGLVAVVAGGAGLVLVVGAVLVSMLLAVAITGASVAVCAVVLRSLLNGQNHR
ncbi:SpdD-like protein [Streptomyces antimicrobicus]|uniref:SpdD-like protein n=1 Tax=Streptomyces antimicrobicus TaxID=2883108 RepID=A0ABS8B6P0_9ACTN|nr:SpdD-like protein [Streptomyces antimicrobicus]MCB5180265.1 SpdD-like protein [Streptomyces antimicrobicus]